MIKKLNTVLVAVFAAMAALKGVKLLTHRSGESADSQAADAERSGGASQLAPHVYYAYWAGYTLQNPVSNRNGILLDMVRAVFPNAEFRFVNGDVSDMADRLRGDSRAVVVGFGAHEALAEFPAAPTPLMHCPLVLMTLRTNPWYYEGFSSLTNLKIVASDSFLDYTVMRRLKELADRGEASLSVMTNAVTKVELAEMVMNGEADAMVIADLRNAEGAPKDGLTAMRFIQNFRKSSVIASDGTLLYVSGLDADFAKKVVEDYESGIRRIDRTGELRRICEYYGTPYDPPRDPELKAVVTP